MKLMFLILGSVFAILFIIQLTKGKKFEPMVENLDDSKFPLKDLYVVGFAWSSTKFLEMKGNKATELKVQAGMLYEPRFAQYYATVVWAQAITFVHLFLSVIFLLASISSDSALMILVAGIFLTILIVAYSLGNMKNELSKVTQECEAELPEVVSTMAILVNSGMMLREAWRKVSENGNGRFYELMCIATENMNNGYSDADAIFIFGKVSNSTEIKKFTSALIQSMEKGGGELGAFLAQQSSDLWNTKRQKKLQSGEKAATKLLLPIVLIFIGIIIIVMTAAFAGLSF